MMRSRSWLFHAFTQWSASSRAWCSSSIAPLSIPFRARSRGPAPRRPAARMIRRARYTGCLAPQVSAVWGSPRTCATRHPAVRRIWSRGNPGRAVWSNWMEGRTGDDASLVDRLRRGEPRAFEDLVIAYQHRVFGVALRMVGNHAEAEELAQEAFLRVHRAINEFRGESKLSTWLYAITSRLCLNRLTSGERRMARQGEETLARPGSRRIRPGAGV